jgi:hypothetical protein
MVLSCWSSFTIILTLDAQTHKCQVKSSHYECVLAINVACVITVIVTNKVWFNDKFRNFKPMNIVYVCCKSPLF